MDGILLLNSIFEIFNNNYMPHGACYFWEPATLWSNVLGDGVTAFSYYMIPGLLIYFVNKRKDVEVNALLVAFAIFIIACGTVHVMMIVNVWIPYYDISGMLKIIMAMVSVGTVFMLWKSMPELINIPSPAALQEANDEIKSLNENLEDKVKHRTKALEEMNSELESFSYSISHDLQIPIRAILGFSAMLEEDHIDQLSEEGTRKLQNISNSALKMNELIQGILEFSRLGRKDKTDSMIDMNLLFKESVNEIKAGETTQKEIELNMEELPSVFGDEAMMKQVVDNLLSNAVKYSINQEKIKIDVSAEVSENEITYFVKDYGIGFDEKYKHKMFDVFQRLHDGNTVKGSGVGLAIVNRIIIKHFGHVDAHSNENGTTIEFTLPKKKLLKPVE
ncbi:MAG: ATP-binding protein [Balneola sp.]